MIPKLEYETKRNETKLLWNKIKEEWSIKSQILFPWLLNLNNEKGRLIWMQIQSHDSSRLNILCLETNFHGLLNHCSVEKKNEKGMTNET